VQNRVELGFQSFRQPHHDLVCEQGALLLVEPVTIIDAELMKLLPETLIHRR
jgi:hypothetical protein